MPSTSATDKSICVEEGPKQIPKDETTEPVSLEMFNKATNDLNTKGIINLKKIQQISSQENIKTYLNLLTA